MSKNLSYNDPKCIKLFNLWKAGTVLSKLQKQAGCPLTSQFTKLAGGKDEFFALRKAGAGGGKGARVATGKLSSDEKEMRKQAGKDSDRKKAEKMAAKQGIKLFNADDLSDTELKKQIIERFAGLEKLVAMAGRGDIPVLVVPGAPGIGKTFRTNRVLKQMGVEYVSINGTISAVELFKLGYHYRRKGQVILMDDADKLLRDEDGVNVLKALTDSGDQRIVSWKKDSSTLAEDGVEQTYEYEGSIILLSNVDFQSYSDAGRGRGSEHMGAIISRAYYLDMLVHDRRALHLLIDHVFLNENMAEMEKVSPTVAKEILTFLHANAANLREYSLRTVHKVCKLTKQEGEDWASLARMTLCR